MTPAPGSYPPSQQITLYVSGGGIQVPNVVNQTAAEAQAILQQDGFNVQTTSTPAPADQMVQPGTVYNQNPAANQVEPKGTLIQIFVQPQNATSTPTGSDRHVHPDHVAVGDGTPTDTPRHRRPATRRHTAGNGSRPRPAARQPEPGSDRSPR